MSRSPRAAHVHIDAAATSETVRDSFTSECACCFTATQVRVRRAPLENAWNYADHNGMTCSRDTPSECPVEVLFARAAAHNQFIAFAMPQDISFDGSDGECDDVSCAPSDGSYASEVPAHQQPSP